MLDPVWFGNVIIPRWEALGILFIAIAITVTVVVAILSVVTWTALRLVRGTYRLFKARRAVAVAVAVAVAGADG